jgi:hypothetical protein
MEEITTRFEIIRLAVNLGDFRTIDLQCEKLRSLSLDEKLNEIIDLLESRNYRQALYEMKHYAKSLEDEFFSQRSKTAPSPSPSRKSTSPSDDLGLFAMEEPEEEEERVLDLDEILRLSESRKSPAAEEYRPAPDFETASSEPEEAPEAEEISEEGGEDPFEEESGISLADHLEDRELESAEHIAEEAREEAIQEGPETYIEEAAPAFREEEWRSEEEPEEPVEAPAVSETPVHAERSLSGEGTTRHPPISYISQKFRNMIHQFPPVEKEETVPEEVERMQKKISSEGYTEEEIEAFLKNYQRYKEQGKRSEAARGLLLAAATESKFAQFLLARELFRGEVIEEDHAESFTQINTLADQNFAEAICDLGQFYEHGIGIGKDRQMALLLYEEAAEMGIVRAQRHYERLKNSRGLLGVFKKVSLPKVSIPLPKKK